MGQPLFWFLGVVWVVVCVCVWAGVSRRCVLGFGLVWVAERVRDCRGSHRLVLAPKRSEAP